LVKRYISETGSAWVLGLFAPALNNEIFIAAIAKVEIVAAITRRSHSGSISVTDATTIGHQFRKDLLKDYQVIEITLSRPVVSKPFSQSPASGYRKPRPRITSL
jgi:hypothetical protein